MSQETTLTKNDLEAIQREWDIQDNSRIRERQIIQDKLFHDVPKNNTTETRKTPDPAPIKELKEGEWLKEITGTLIDDPIQRDVDTRNGPATVANFRMEGKHGTIKVGLWNKQAEEIMNFTSGARITLTNVQVKPTYDGVQQISGSRNTKIKEAKA